MRECSIIDFSFNAEVIHVGKQHPEDCNHEEQEEVEESILTLRCDQE
jgi:hypothetical protein